MNERVEPWFGTWPPKVRADKTQMGQDNKKGFWSKIFSPTNLILAGASLVGVFLIVRTSGFWIHIGIALLVTGLLGLTIDKYLKRELSKEAVKAALGYVLPDALKEEMRWVVGLKFLAIEHAIKYEIRINEDGKTVSLHVEMTRRLKNFTETSQTITPSLSIDEMGINGKPSRIEEFCYHLKNHAWKYIDGGKTKSKGDILEITANKKERVPPDEWIEIKSKFQETKQINDVHFMVLTNPTVQPTISIQADNGIEHREGFTHRNGEPRDDMLKGTLLPYHSIYVRWWPSKNKKE